jgi:hypothetical protein
MDSQNQALLRKVLEALRGNRMRKAAARSREKTETEYARSEITLMLDDLQSEGIDINTPAGKAILLELIARRQLNQDPTGHTDLEDAAVEAWARRRR